MDLENLFRLVTQRGLLVNNLFQLDERRWQANVTDNSRYWEFGRGETPQEALSAALFKVDTTMPEIVMDRPVRAAQEYSPKPPKFRPSAEPIDSSMLEDI
jgi:hypothetical protein